MIKNRSGHGSVLLLGWLLVSCAPSFAEDRSPAKILADIKAVEMPARPSDATDREAVMAFSERMQVARATTSKLIGELFKANPDQPELASLLPTRWQVLALKPDTLATLQDETNRVQANGKDEKLVNEAFYYKALSGIRSSVAGPKAKDVLGDLEAFARRSPKDTRLPTLLFGYATQLDHLDATEEVFKRIEKDFPNTPTAKQVVSARARMEGERRKLERVGKPFELEFTDAIKGTPITMASLKGKVVVVDFWATWCGPCIAEMPKMKRLYAEFKDKGVEFIGVSLDQPKEKGGLDKLKEYVAKNEIEWPQYYQGNFWQSEFSSSWDIHAIPCVFLVDADGNLASIKARGRLETLIPEYLEKARSKGVAKTAASR